MALCPGHDDSERSLSVTEAEDRILVNCFAGCELLDILKPLDLEPKDLFLNSHKSQSQKQKKQKTLVATFSYQDITGKELYQIRRFSPKAFEAWHRDADGRYIPGLGGIKPVPYKLPELVEWIRQERKIYIPEGEGKADELVRLGLAATTAPFGAGRGKWLSDYNQYFKGAQEVVILADNDDVGKDYAEEKAQNLISVGKSVKLLLLPNLPPKGDIVDWLDSGGSIEELERLSVDCPEYQQPDAILPEILVTNRHLRDITTDALEALYEANNPERIFRRGGVPTRINLDEKGRPYTEALSEAAFRGCLARSADFLRVTAKGDTIAVPPPLDVVRDCLSLGEWQFPALLGITEVPVIRPDGTVMTKPGYDSATNLYYYPSPKLSVPPIPDNPGDADVKAAIHIALEPLADFPFDSEASRANAIATIFTPILRPIMEGPVPLAIIDKPQAGTGASLLAEVISVVATGRPAAMMTAQKDDEGWRKAITSLLLKGQLVVTIDNIESTLFTPSLAAILTATTYQDRILGRSEMVILPNRTTWIGTGNNIKLAGDLPRRCIWVRMDARMARPWLRNVSTFKHPHLIQWVSENRGAILGAILTIARAWATAGMPEAQDLPNLGGYESYCRVIGGVLAYMGISGFLANLDAMYNETDTETPQWEAFLEVWHDVLGDKAVTAAELISYLNSDSELRGALPDAIADTESRNYVRRLGNALAKKKGVRFPNGLSIAKAGEYNRAAKWQVMSPQKADSYQSEFNYESYESATTPTSCKKGIDDKNIYKDGSPQDSEDSYSTEKKYESEPDDMPDYPTHPCTVCGCDDYWLTDRNTWLCSRCHPRPAGGNGE